MTAGRSLQQNVRRIVARRTRRPFLASSAAPQIGSEHPPDVTVIVPAFQHERYIEASLGSVLSQSYQGFRVDVIDDCSPDRTAARAALQTDPRISVRTNARNAGLAATVLEALADVTTPYVAILNSDDLYHPERLARCRRVLEARPDADVVATGVIPIDEDGLCVTPSRASRWLDGVAVVQWMQWFSKARRLWEARDIRLALLETNFLVTSSNVFCRTEFLRSRRELLQGFRYCLDWQIFVEAAAAGRLLLIPDDLLAYRLHRTNTIWLPHPTHRAEFVLEVNRVLANGLRHLCTSLEALPVEDRVARLGQAIAGHVRRQPDARPYALLLASLAGGAALPTDREKSRVMREAFSRLTSQ